jgi:hypothetical protein
MHRTVYRSAAAWAAGVFLAGAALAQSPLGSGFTYQGQLRQNGTPFTGNATITFDLYDGPSGGNLIGTETLGSVPVTEGLFTVRLNDGGQFGVNAFNGNARWLAITVNGAPLTPRQELTAAPHALFALDADRLDGLDSTAFLQSVPVPLTLSGTSATHIIRGENAAGNSGATGVFGLCTGASGIKNGVYGLSNSTQGRGVLGWADAATGTTYGVYGLNDSTSGRGVYGLASTATGTTYGVYGDCVSTTGIGVRGRAQATTGVNYGGYFQSNSDSGTAVFATATTTNDNDNHYGVYASASGAFGRGVWGVNTNTVGGAAGVVGENDSGNYGVFSYGNLGASGTKSFMIDHPLDPENKYLKHYCTEGPEPQNVYNGVVTTGADGKAWVELPDYFAAINESFRYQLTVVDDTEGPGFVQVKIARKIEDNRFMIMTSAPNIEVSWEVKARRNDLWVQKHGAPAEVDKPDHERGKYQHPELYGQPAERGVNFHRVNRLAPLESKENR